MALRFWRYSRKAHRAPRGGARSAYFASEFEKQCQPSPSLTKPVRSRLRSWLLLVDGLASSSIARTHSTRPNTVLESPSPVLFARLPRPLLAVRCRTAQKQKQEAELSTAIRKVPGLSDAVRRSGTNVVVNAFHGHAHNRICQLQHHIQLHRNAGIENLETCERYFAETNKAARVTRHASAFRRRTTIIHHVGRINRDRYCDIGEWTLPTRIGMMR